MDVLETGWSSGRFRTPVFFDNVDWSSDLTECDRTWRIRFNRKYGCQRNATRKGKDHTGLIAGFRFIGTFIARGSVITTGGCRCVLPVQVPMKRRTAASELQQQQQHGQEKATYNCRSLSHGWTKFNQSRFPVKGPNN